MTSATLRPAAIDLGAAILLVATLVAVGAAALGAAGPAASRRPPTADGAGGSGLGLRGSHAYPEPILPPSPTPPADADGFLPPPIALPHIRAPLERAPGADLLLDLDRKLAARDAAGLAARAGSERRPLLLLPWRQWDTEGVAALDPRMAETLLAGLLSEPAGVPRMQGLFHLPSSSGDGGCVEVLLHRFGGSMAWPGSATAPPPATEDVGGLDASGPVQEAGSWRFCRGLQEPDWTWESWRSGPYHGLLDGVAERYPGVLYWLLRP